MKETWEEEENLGNDPTPTHIKAREYSSTLLHPSHQPVTTPRPLTETHSRPTPKVKRAEEERGLLREVTAGMWDLTKEGVGVVAGAVKDLDREYMVSERVKAEARAVGGYVLAEGKKLAKEGMEVVKDKVEEIDQEYQVSEKTKQVVKNTVSHVTSEITRLGKEGVHLARDKLSDLDREYQLREKAKEAIKTGIVCVASEVKEAVSTAVNTVQTSIEQSTQPAPEISSTEKLAEEYTAKIVGREKSNAMDGAAYGQVWAASQTDSEDEEYTGKPIIISDSKTLSQKVAVRIFSESAALPVPTQSPSELTNSTYWQERVTSSIRVSAYSSILATLACRYFGLYKWKSSIIIGMGIFTTMTIYSTLPAYNNLMLIKCRQLVP